MDEISSCKIGKSGNTSEYKTLHLKADHQHRGGKCPLIQMRSLTINDYDATTFIYTHMCHLVFCSTYGFGLCCPSFQVFRPYAKHLLGPLMQLVVSGNNGGEGIHFMVVDIVVTVLSWTSLASPKVF